MHPHLLADSPPFVSSVDSATGPKMKAGELPVVIRALRPVTLPLITEKESYHSYMSELDKTYHPGRKKAEALRLAEGGCRRIEMLEGFPGTGLISKRRMSRKRRGGRFIGIGWRLPALDSESIYPVFLGLPGPRKAVEPEPVLLGA